MELIMNLFITLYLAFVCTSNGCTQQTLTISREAMAIASCESGDGINYGTYNFNACLKKKQGWSLAIQ
jgi:hypothetical protein